MNPVRERTFLILVLLAVFALLAQAAHHSAEFLSMDRKIGQIEANAGNAKPTPLTTQLTQQELNAYFNEGGVQIPKGISNPKLELSSGVVHATGNVDFDQLATSQQGMNPIFSALFTGVHDVEVLANGSGKNGRGTIAVQWVKLDGIQIPRTALDYLIQHYVKPKYPGAGMTTNFPLPDRIQTAVVQQSQVVLTQQ